MSPIGRRSTRGGRVTSKSEVSTKSKGVTKPTTQPQKSKAATVTNSSPLKLVTHLGGCHCGAVRFSVQALAHLDVVQCNCSICLKKQNHHFIVPKSRFKLLQGSKSLTTYTFNTHMAKHTFCKVCGVQSFYTPRSNPDGYGIMPHCVDPGTVKSTTVSTFDGSKWEESIKSSDIRKYSKEPVRKKSRR